MDISAPLIAVLEMATAMQSRDGAFDDPAVATKHVLGFNPDPSNPDLDVAPVQEAPTAGHVIPLVRMQSVGPVATMVIRLLDQRNGIDHHEYPNAYRRRRLAFSDVGNLYVDPRGRHHHLYTWGDVPEVATRLAADPLLVRRR